MTAAAGYAADASPTTTVGTQEVGLTAGYMIFHQLTDATQRGSKEWLSCPPG